MKTRIIIFLLCVMAVLAGISAANYAPRNHVDADLYDQRFPRQVVMVGDEQPVIWYNTEGGQWYWFSIRSSPLMVTDVNYLWPIDQGDANSVLFTPGGSSPVQLVWATVDANLIDVNDSDPNVVAFELPTLTPGSRIFVDANGFPLFEDNDNAYFDDVNDFAGFALGHISSGTRPNNYIQVYKLLNFDPNLLNVSVGWAREDVLDGPNNVRIGEGAGGVLETAKENALGGKDAGRYLVDANDNAGWGYKVIGGLASVTAAEYPTLQELTAAEIPNAPTEPPDTPLSSPTEITDYAGLQAMAGSGHYKIMGNIDLDGETWTPIANFSGVVEGNGNTISNLSINTPTLDNKAMFSSLSSNAEIRNLTFSDCSIIADDNAAILVASITTKDAIILKNITFNNCTILADRRVGCLIGTATGLTNCMIYDCNAVNCTVEAEAQGDVGGLIGAISPINTTGEPCYIVRCSTQGGSVSSTGSAGDYCGGLVGRVTATTKQPHISQIYDSYSTASVDADGGVESIGGFVGWLSGWDCITCYATGDVSQNHDNDAPSGGNVGGFIGDASCFHDFINCYSTGNITVDFSGSTGQKETYDGRIGGFIGLFDMEDSHVLRCYSTGSITTVGEMSAWGGVGGFIGYLRAGAEVADNPLALDCLIERSWSEGDITLDVGNSAPTENCGGVGGFLGALFCAITPNAEIQIYNCYAWGSIDFNDDDEDTAVGGFMGSEYALKDLTVTIDNCYDAQTDTAAGSSYSDQIQKGNYTNGFIGKMYASTYPTVNDSFWDTDTSSILTDDYGDGHITSWMQTKDNFTDAGWNFTTIWTMPDDGPNVHRVAALGAYAASSVKKGADDGLYLGTYAGSHNETDPNRFFLDNLDRGSYANEKTKGMMYGYFAADPNDQWLNINADVNIPSLALTDLTDSRLVATDADKKLISTDANDWIDGTANQITVTNDGDGTITLSAPQDIHTGAKPTFAGLTISGDSITITTPKTPTASNDTGTKGDIAWDSSYVYVCIAADTWKRAVINTWGIPAEKVIYAGENVIYAGENIVYP